MSHQETDGNTASSPHHQALKQALDWLVKSAGLSDLVFRADNSVSEFERQFGVSSSLLLPLR